MVEVIESSSIAWSTRDGFNALR